MTALPPPLIGTFDRDDIVEELRYRLEHWGDEDDAEEYLTLIAKVESMSDRDLELIHLHGGDALIDSLHQSPLSFLIDQIERLK